MQQQRAQKLDKAIATIKERMKLINYNNLQPPYFLHTLTKYRQNYFSPFIKDINLEAKDSAAVRQKLQTVRYIIEKFDDEYFDAYVGQLLEPYTRKMFQDNYGFDAVDFKQANTEFHLKAEIQETLGAAAEWLTQVQITQDLLARLELYFKVKTPHVIEKVRQEGFKSEKNTWTGTIGNFMKKMVSYSLRKGSKTIQSAFLTALAPAAIMLTLAIMGGTSTLPWKTDLDINALIPAITVIAVPYALDSMAESVQKSSCADTLKRWALTFSALAQNITKFNECLQSSIRNCTISATVAQFEMERTNLQKIIHELNNNITSITDFSEEKLEQMRERTEAYFKEYLQIPEGEWIVVIPKEEAGEQKMEPQKKQEIDPEAGLKEIKDL